MTRWVTPTAVPYVTSPFNLLRVHPVTGRPQPHWGTDYRAPLGEPLRAAADGVVTRSLGGDLVSGNYVRVDVGGGVWIGYSHLSRRLVEVGQRVVVGQLVGLAGATGTATGPHLHFEVSDQGVKVDPVPFLAARNAPPAPVPAPPAQQREADPVVIIVNNSNSRGAIVYASGRWAWVTDGADAYALAAATGTQVVGVSDGTFVNMTDPNMRAGA